MCINGPQTFSKVGHVTHSKSEELTSDSFMLVRSLRPGGSMTESGQKCHPIDALASSINLVVGLVSHCSFDKHWSVGF